MADDGDKRLQAFQLGWTLAEILGRVRRGARPSRSRESRLPSYAPRLSVSTGKLRTSTDQFNEAVLRLETLAAELGVIEEERPSEDPIRAPIERLKQAVVGEESVTFGPPLRLRGELQEWSLIVRAQLLSQDLPLAQAMTAGSSLADTFWYMRQVPKPPSDVRNRLRSERVAEQKSLKVPKGRQDEDLRRLLSDYRLKVVRGRLVGLSETLPPHVAGMLVYHLRHWQIGRELAYDGRGYLYRLPWYRRIGWPGRTPAWIRKRWPRYDSPRLLPEDEDAVQRALERQVARWQDMLFGWRRPDEFLWWIDRLAIAGIRFVALLFLSIVVGLALALLIYTFGYIVNLVVSPAVPDVLAHGELDDRLKLLAAVGGWLTLAWTVGRAGVGWIPRALRWLENSLTAWLLAQRTLVRWDSTYIERLREEKL